MRNGSGAGGGFSSINGKTNNALKSKQQLNSIMPVITAARSSALVPFTANPLGKVRFDLESL